MMPVCVQPEPAKFDERVRQRGHRWLVDKGWAMGAPAPDASALPTYWRETQRELWSAYGGVCAYLCIFFEWASGASSTDHFVAKSVNAGQAYEWDNFRLSCMGANRNKGRFDDVLDPFAMSEFAFELNLANGEMLPGRHLALDDAVRGMAMTTIERLHLNDVETAGMRAQHVTDYLNRDVSADYLRRRSPFVWAELVRQGVIVQSSAIVHASP